MEDVNDLMQRLVDVLAGVEQGVLDGAVDRRQRC